VDEAFASLLMLLPYRLQDKLLDNPPDPPLSNPSLGNSHAELFFFYASARPKTDTYSPQTDRIPYATTDHGHGRRHTYRRFPVHLGLYSSYYRNRYITLHHNMIMHCTCMLGLISVLYAIPVVDIAREPRVNVSQERCQEFVAEWKNEVASVDR